MSKVAVIYWSGTGHTEAMAEAVAKGADGVLLTLRGGSPRMLRRSTTRLRWAVPRWAARSWRRTSSSPLFETL